MLDFKNLSSKFPLQLAPNEGQIYLLFGGTYGNFKHEEINSYLQKIINTKNAILVVSIPIRDFIPKQKIIDSYLNQTFQNYLIQPLIAFGFKEQDFSNNTNNENLKMNIEFIDNCIKTFFILESDKVIQNIQFKKGMKFSMTSSWKPTLNEFRMSYQKSLK